jgi:uncharacterized membrane protein YedE/YeeE
MTAFAPGTALLGGVLIGLSAGLLWLFGGRIAGISGIFGGIVPLRGREIAWRLAFLAGLPLGAGAFYLLARPERLPRLDGPLPLLILAGLLVGLGTRIGGGCTSGHGVCGLARFSPRSLVAVLVFMATGAATVYLTRHAS